MSETHPPVLIVGGGISGLSSALFLSWHGVPCTLVERHADLLIHPRARGLTPRTMEIYRQVGLEESIYSAAYAGGDFEWVPIRADTLSDAEYAEPDEPHEDDGSGASPSSFGPIDQDKLEALVRERARELGADLRFATELAAFEQRDDGIVARLVDRVTGEEQTMNACYLIAADGVDSPIRQRLGIDVDGPGRMFDTMTAIVDADLNPALRGRRVTIAYLQRPRPFTIMMAHDNDGKRWVFGTGYDAATESLADFTDERVADMVRAAAGLDDLDVTLRPQIPGTDLKVLGFPIVAQVARRYRSGRVFLVGDAAHSWPPTGGLGANAGIQDAHNLAWKLAAVIRGDAGPALLDTYHDERRPTGLLTMEQALARFGTRMGPGDGPKVIEYGAVASGYQYRSSAVVGAGDDTSPVPPGELDGRPGTRAPHVEVAPGTSTLDRYGSRFVLLTGPDSAPWTATAAELGLDVYRLDREVAVRHGLEAGGAALVRPDGFVAWRTRTGVADPAAALRDVHRRVLARDSR